MGKGKFFEISRGQRAAEKPSEEREKEKRKAASREEIEREEQSFLPSLASLLF